MPSANADLICEVPSKKKRKQSLKNRTQLRFKIQGIASGHSKTLTDLQLICLPVDSFTCTAMLLDLYNIWLLYLT